MIVEKFVDKKIGDKKHPNSLGLLNKKTDVLYI